MFNRTTLRRRLSRLAVILSALIMPVAIPVSVDAAPSWRIIDLGMGDNSYAYALNDRGHVVGTDSMGRAFLWREGQVTYLTGPGSSAIPYDINNRDEVVGNFGLWRNGVFIDGVPGGTAINDRGEIVGQNWLWSHGVVTPLPGLPGAWTTYATDINNAGTVVGSSGDMNAVSVRWRDGAIETIYGVPSAAVAINRRGAIAGRVYSGRLSGYLWERGQVTVIEPPAGAGMFQPYGMNDRTQIVGTTSLGAVVWQRGRFTVLPPLTAGLAGAFPNDINNRGQIAGTSPTGLYVPNWRAVLWTR